MSYFQENLKDNKTYCDFERKFETLLSQVVNFANYQTSMKQRLIQKYKIDDQRNEMIKWV